MTRPDPNRKSVTLGFVGDLMLGRKVSAKLADGTPPADLWGDVRSQMLAADAMIGNLEGPITTHTTRWNRSKAYYFRADPIAAEALAAGNFRCVALANNHMLDFADEGLADTRKYLADAGIAFAGAGPDRDAAEEPTIFTAGGFKIGFLSMTNTVPAFAAAPDRAGTCHWRMSPDRKTMYRLAVLVYKMRQMGAEFLVLSIHWGPNFRPWPPRRYRTFARRAIELGFDVIHGHSAHILQPAEYYHNGLILYDTGDFMDDYWVFPGIRADRSFLFMVEAKPGGPPGVRMVPVNITPGAVNIAKGREAAAIKRGMIRRCDSYAIDLVDDGDALAGRPPPKSGERRDHTGSPTTAPANSTANSTNK